MPNQERVINTSLKRTTAKEICRHPAYDAVVVGSGPNGLACAAAMLQAGCSVLVVEGQATGGGGCRTAELTLPGFKHDICSAVHPLGLGSPFFRTLPLNDFGLKWINPEAAYVHAFRPGKALVVERNLEATARNLGSNGDSFRQLMESIYPDWDLLCQTLLHPVNLARYPIAMSAFGSRALLSAQALADRLLFGAESKAAFAGVAAHSTIRLDSPASASIGLALGVAAHAVGWPIPEGGAQAITDSLVKYIQSLDGEVILNCPVRTLEDLPACKFLFLDVTPRQFIQIADNHLSSSYKKRLEHYRYGPGCFKMDWALSGPIPWSSPDFARAPTVHLGGTFEEVAEAELQVTQGNCPARPFVLLAQPSFFDQSRAPANQHSVWGYCHVPYGFDGDVSENIEMQIERFAPGFRKTILARSILKPKDLQRLNENHIGGDINGGSLALSQLFARPLARMIPYKTALANVFLCSSSTPPGSGVHGMCGYYAAWFALNIGSKGRMAIKDSA